MASPSTVFLGVPGQQTATFNVAAGVFQYVESILVEIDNTAGPDVRPTLKVASPSGVVMATKRQGEVIPAGDTGTATWALRLADETPPSGGGFAPLLENVADTSGPFGTTVASNTTALAPWTSLGGDVILDLTVPTTPTVLVDGVYIFDMNFNCVPTAPLTLGTPLGSLLTFNDFVIPTGTEQKFDSQTFAVGFEGASMSITRRCFAGTTFQFTYTNGAAAPYAAVAVQFQMSGTVTRIA